MNFALINPRVWLELIVAALLLGAGWWTYNWIYDRGEAHVQAKWDKDRQQIQTQSAKIAADALATTKQLATTIDTQRSETNAQISALNISLGSAIAGLRQRPDRPATSSLPSTAPVTGTAAGCTGAGLYGQDAEFLIWEAATAKHLRIELKACYAQYRTARATLK